MSNCLSRKEMEEPSARRGPTGKNLSTITRQAADHETESLGADPEAEKQAENDDQEWGTTPVSISRSICF